MQRFGGLGDDRLHTRVEDDVLVLVDRVDVLDVHRVVMESMGVRLHERQILLFHHEGVEQDLCRQGHVRGAKRQNPRGNRQIVESVDRIVVVSLDRLGEEAFQLVDRLTSVAFVDARPEGQDSRGGRDLYGVHVECGFTERCVWLMTKLFDRLKQVTSKYRDRYFDLSGRRSDGSGAVSNMEICKLASQRNFVAIRQILDRAVKAPSLDKFETIVVTTDQGREVELPKILVDLSTVEPVPDEVADIMDEYIDEYRLKYSLSTYRLFDLLGINGIFSNVEHDIRHKPRCVMSSDGKRIPLPRDFDYTSKLLKDQKDLQVPFHEADIVNCISYVLEGSRQGPYAYEFLEFLQCDKILDSIIADLTANDWSQVLTFEPCLEQRLSGFTLSNNKLKKKDITIELKDDGIYVKTSSSKLEMELHRALRSGGKLVRYQNYLIDVEALKWHKRVYCETASDLTQMSPVHEGSINVWDDDDIQMYRLYRLGVKAVVGSDSYFETLDERNKIIVVETRKGRNETFSVKYDDHSIHKWNVSKV